MGKAKRRQVQAKPDARSVRWTYIMAAFAIAYTAIALSIEACAVKNIHLPIFWGFIHWYMPNGLHPYTLVGWFLIPFLLSLKSMDWGYLGVKRWRKVDVYFLLALAAVGMLAVLSTRWFSSLRNYSQYHGVGTLTTPQIWQYLSHQFLWTFSWLVGWEFMHRYFLLRNVEKAWPRYGWLLVPLSEGVYHLLKPLPETAGMVIFSLPITYWTMKRKNMLLPFLAHAIIEIELIIFLLFV